MYSNAHKRITDYENDWTIRELNFAQMQKKRIVFINIDGSELTDWFKLFFGTKQQINGCDNESIERLIRDFKKWNGSNRELIETDIQVVSRFEDKSLLSRFKRANWVKPYLKDMKKRQWFVNIVLYGLEIVGLFALVPCFFMTLWSINLLTDPTWSLLDAYGKGFIPGLLITTSIVIFNGMIIRWNKNGFVYLFCSLFFIVLPTMYNEFNEFVAFSIFIFAGLFVYLCLLFCRKRRISVWNSSTSINNRNKFLWIFVSITWIFMLTILPLYMAKAVGFGNNLYDNGARYLDARWNESPYYSHNFANRIGFSDDFVGRRYDAREWYEKSILLAKSEKTRLHDWSLEYICDYLIFLCIDKDSSSVRELYEEACSDYGKNNVDNEIVNGSDFDDYISKSDRDKTIKFVNHLYKK